MADWVSRSVSRCWVKLRVPASRNNWRVATNAFVGMTANRSANARAAATLSSATSQIKPHSLALSAESLSPVMAKAMARAIPKRSTNNQLPPASGIKPILLNA